MMMFKGRMLGLVRKTNHSGKRCGNHQATPTFKKRRVRINVGEGSEKCREGVTSCNQGVEEASKSG